MEGMKHLVQCHCILPQFKNRKEPYFHKFAVFSIIDDGDTVIPKYVNCNNCGILHKVYDICKSEIVTGKEDAKQEMKIKDFKLSLPSGVYEVLMEYNKEASDFEHAQFIIDYEKWGASIILSREQADNSIQGKLLKFITADKFRIESFVHQESVG
jgi:hypothetical protein